MSLEIEINHLISKLPNDYLEWIEKNGAVKSNDGYMVYSGPVLCTEILSDIEDENNILLVADDMAGYSIGYHYINKKMILVGIDSCTLEIEELHGNFSDRIKL